MQPYGFWYIGGDLDGQFHSDQKDSQNAADGYSRVSWNVRDNRITWEHQGEASYDAMIHESLDRHLSELVPTVNFYRSHYDGATLRQSAFYERSAQLVYADWLDENGYPLTAEEARWEADNPVDVLALCDLDRARYLVPQSDEKSLGESDALAKQKFGRRLRRR